MDCVIGLMTFASCDPEVMEQMMEKKPEITIVEAEGYISHSIGVRLDEELSLDFKVTVAPNSSSLKELTNVEFTVKDLDGSILFSDNGEIENPNDENTMVFSYEPEEAGTYVCTVTVTDADNKTNEVKIAVMVSEPVESVYGTYSGTLDMNGYVTTNEIAGYEGYDHEEFEVKDVPVTITLGEIDEEGKILVGVDIEDTYLAIEGEMVDNTVSIDGILFYRYISLFVRVNVEFAVNIIGTIDEGVMELSGSASGTGKAQVIATILEATFEDGTIEGTLEEVVE